MQPPSSDALNVAVAHGLSPARVLYRVEHTTRYIYTSVVSTSQHVAHLRPRELAYQHVLEHELAIDPPPASRLHRFDAFGNFVEQFHVLRPHSEFQVISRSDVELQARAGCVEPGLSPPWEDVRDGLRWRVGQSATEASQFICASPYVTLAPELETFAHDSFPAGRPLLAAAIDLMHRIHAGFRFDPAATTITTPVTRVLTERRGVCQDFAHLQISCLRSLGLAARYVSGYLLTDPPSGGPRLVGADASHAWVSVHCPRHGWVDLDPTNDVIVNMRHVTLAWGRDYGDVSPLRGVLLGGAEHRLHVGVSVVPLDAGATPSLS